MNFLQPQILFALLLLPVLVSWMIWIWMSRRKNMKKLAPGGRWEVLAPERNRAKFISKTILRCLALSLLIIAFAGPVAGIRYRTTQRASAEIMILLDVSYSMMAQDELPTRFQKAQITVSELLAQLDGDKIGIALIGGEGIIQLPITSDYGAVAMMLESLEPGAAPVEGTNIGGGMKQAISGFNDQSQAGKALVLLSDGENHEAGTPEAIQELKNRNITVFSVGFGTEQGAPIQIRQEDGSVISKTDMQGNTINTQLDEKNLTDIAEKTGGYYIYGGDPQSAAKQIISSINQMEKFRTGESKYSEGDYQFQYFLLGALLLVFIDLLLTDRPTRIWKKLGFFETRKS